MKILLWNIERLKHTLKKEKIISVIKNFNADVILLTETNDIITVDTSYNIVATSPLLKMTDDILYNKGENRVTLFSKFPVFKTVPTYDLFTSLCADINTPFGVLRIYGTITGILGGKGNRFKEDLENQIADMRRLHDRNFCIAGDINTTFSGFTYPSHEARNTFTNFFDTLNLKNTTEHIDNNVDHIIFSKDFIEGKTVNTLVFNTNKKLSDHIGIVVEIF